MNDQLKSEGTTISDELSVIVVAAGESMRMAGIDKLNLEIAGTPVLWRSIDAFDAFDAVTKWVIVTHATKVGEVEESVSRFGLTKPFKVVAGGARRQDSVRCGLVALNDWGDSSAFIAVHDAARPFVDGDMIRRGLDAAKFTGAAIPVVPIKDTVKRVEHGIIIDTPDRSSMFAVQTPQIFRADVLRAAHETVADDVTDDASMVEVAGGLVGTFAGSDENIKITTQSDIAVANAIAAKRSPTTAVLTDFRCGIGFDGHALVDGGPLRLGGVVIEFDKRLQGHSDGDVLLHAVASAILGAAGLGDLGGNFPSSDPKYRGVDSAFFVGQAMSKASESRWQIDHIDSTVIAQRPRLAPHVSAFRSNIARALSTEEDRVNVKVTSTDQVGSIGRGEGIAAQAIATLRR